MKFLNCLKEDIITEWKDFYIDYELLLSIIYKVKNKNISSFDENGSYNLSNENSLTERLLEDKDNPNYYNIIKNHFLLIYQIEIKKFRFFCHLQICIRQKERFDSIIEQLEYIRKNKEYTIFKDQIEKIFKAFYRDISVFSNFINTNLSINKKIVNKYQKYFKSSDSNILQNFELCLNVIIAAEKLNSKLIEETEKRFSFYFYEKYNMHPIKVLKTYIINKHISSYQAFKFGIICGSMILLLCTCIYLGFQYGIDMDSNSEFRSIFPMYRTFGIVCIYLWLLGTNVLAWEGANINYKALFKFDNHYSDVVSIYNRCAFFTILLLFSLLLYFLIRSNIKMFSFLDNKITIDVLPLICWGSLLIYFFMPFKIFNYTGRIYTMKLFVESVASILVHIEFRHIWFMDQLTSLIGPMRDIEYTFCYYSYYIEDIGIRQNYCNYNRSIYLLIGIFPNFIRILQCCRLVKDQHKIKPHIFNMGKYSFNIIVCTFSYLTSFNNKFYICWFIAAFISGCYSSFWDIVMDFGFFQKGPNYPLRNRLAYKNKFLYYFAIINNVILRFLWVLSISPEMMNKLIRPEFLALILYLLEMLRRGQWNFIRVEYEQLDLIKKFQISYYEDLPFIKKNNMFFVNFENINIVTFDKEDKIKFELKEIFGKKLIDHLSYKCISCCDETAIKFENYLKEYHSLISSQTQKFNNELSLDLN